MRKFLFPRTFWIEIKNSINTSFSWWNIFALVQELSCLLGNRDTRKLDRCRTTCVYKKNIHSPDRNNQMHDDTGIILERIDSIAEKSGSLLIHHGCNHSTSSPSVSISGPKKISFRFLSVNWTNFSSAFSIWAILSFVQSADLWSECKLIKTIFLQEKISSTGLSIRCGWKNNTKSKQVSNRENHFQIFLPEEFPERTKMKRILYQNPMLSDELYFFRIK